MSQKDQPKGCPDVPSTVHICLHMVGHTASTCVQISPIAQAAAFIDDGQFRASDSFPQILSNNLSNYNIVHGTSE